MTSAELYLEGSSWLHRADARVKLAMALALIGSLLLIQNLPIMAAAIFLLLLLHGSAAVPARRLLRVGSTLLPVSLLMLALRALFYPQGGTLLQLGPIALTDLGLADGAVVALRLLALAFAVLLWLYTTRSRDVVRSLEALGLPFSWGLAFSLALRYLPEFSATYQAVEQAQQSRGLDLAAARGLARVRKRMPIFVAMLITTLRRSEQMAVALEARGFGSVTAERTDLDPLEFRPQDAVFLAIIGVLTTVAFLARFRWGWGLHPWDPLV